MSYLADKHGITFWAFCEFKFDAEETHKSVDRKNPISGHSYTELVPKKNIKDIERRNERNYQKFLEWRKTQPWYGDVMPRTIREAKMIQARIDGRKDWYNVK